MKEYKFEHVTDLTLLDEADIEQFCSELPTLISALQSAKVLTDIAGVELQQATPFITWRNDGEDISRVTIK